MRPKSDAPDDTPEERTERVDNIIQAVGLSSRQDTIVGSPEQKILSGGQRRRVGVALELAGDPDLLLLDEPLSGLSSQDAVNMAILFKNIAQQGTAVVLVVHQPSAELYDYFDKIVVLDVGGKLAFYGNPTYALEYFSRHAQLRASDPLDSTNPDIILAVMQQKQAVANDSGEHERLYPPEYWQELFISKEKPQEQFWDQNTIYITGPQAISPQKKKLKTSFNSIWAIFQRHLLIRRRNNIALLMSALVAPVLGLLLSAVFISPVSYRRRDCWFIVWKCLSSGFSMFELC